MAATTTWCIASKTSVANLILQHQFVATTVFIASLCCKGLKYRETARIGNSCHFQPLKISVQMRAKQLDCRGFTCVCNCRPTFLGWKPGRNCHHGYPKTADSGRERMQWIKTENRPFLHTLVILQFTRFEFLFYVKSILA